MTAITKSNVNITVAPDKLRAHLHLDPVEVSTGADPVDQEAVVDEDVLIDLVRGANIAITDVVMARIRSIAARLVSGPLSDDKEYIIAEGRLPRPPVDAKLELSEELSPTAHRHREESDGDDRIDYYAQSHLVTVKPDGVIGMIKAAQPALAGVDVYGDTIPAPGKPAVLTIGEGVRVDEDGKTLYATVAGIVRVRKNQVSVVDVVQINGDVDFKSGSMNVDSEVMIKGTIRDLFSIKSRRTISVGEAVEGAHLDAGDDVLVRGGIAARGKGSIRAGGQVVCKFCTGATIHAGGDILIAKEAVASQLHTHRQLMIPRGQLIGGRAYARGGAVIKEVGSVAEVPTILVIGLDPAILVKASRIDGEVAKRARQAEKIRSVVLPLVANLKRLDPAQRERATQLLLEADSIQSGSDALIAGKEKMMAEGSWHEEPFLTVTARINPGVTLIFEDLEFLVRELIHGPIKIIKRRVVEGQANALVGVNMVSGSRRELLCRKSTVDLPTEESTETAKSMAEVNF